jgi:hypothetical protein
VASGHVSSLQLGNRLSLHLHTSSIASSFTLYPPTHRCPHGYNNCSSPRSDEFGLSKTPTKQDNPPRLSAPLIRLVCHVSISIQMIHFPASIGQSTVQPLALSDEEPKHDGEIPSPWIFKRARRVCPDRYLMKICIN